MIGYKFKTPMVAATGLLLAAMVVGACSSAAATQNVVVPTQPPAVVPTQAPSVVPTQAPVAASATVLAKTTGAGTVLVAGSNGMTVYTFTKDTAGDGKSACSGACLAKWPALTVPAGATPTGGTGVSGTLGTITRADDGTLQVTFNGLPLYFYAGDKAPGDTFGSYTNWNLVKP
jgi:predicted lipoprotein with Yx(FWY)xxD motif